MNGNSDSLDALELSEEERRILAVCARQQASYYEDPRYGLHKPDAEAKQARWRTIADRLHTNPWGKA